MDSIVILFMIFGAILTVWGIKLFTKMGAQGSNTIKMLGMEFQLTGSALVITVLGVILLLVGFTRYKGDVTDPPISPKPSPTLRPSPTATATPAATPLRTLPPIRVVSDLGKLSDRLRGGSPEERKTAAQGLAAKGAEAVPALVEGLKDEDPAVVGEVLRSLEKIGHPAKEAIPAVRAASERTKQQGRRTLVMGVQFYNTLCAIDPNSNCQGSAPGSGTVSPSPAASRP